MRLRKAYFGMFKRAFESAWLGAAGAAIIASERKENARATYAGQRILLRIEDRIVECSACDSRRCTLACSKEHRVGWRGWDGWEWLASECKENAQKAYVSQDSALAQNDDRTAGEHAIKQKYAFWACPKSI
jgi:hypothetical protein